MTGRRGWLPERQTDWNGVKVLQKGIHLLIPHVCTTWTCWLTIRFAFHFWGFGDRSDAVCVCVCVCVRACVQIAAAQKKCMLKK